MHETKRRMEVGVVLKFDFKKPYAKVHWGFLIQCLHKAGFSETWYNWIKKILEHGTVAVKMNNNVGNYFLSYKGVRQGDPLSSLLFNFPADVLTRMVTVVPSNLLVTGLAENIVDHGVAILQYADDTVMCLEDNMDKARNVKLSLYLFEQMTGLKINFDKSEIILIGGDNNLAVQYADLFNCQVGLFHMKYLGVSIAPGRLHVIDWARLEEKYGKKHDIWQGGSLSMVDRTTLINASLVNSTIYHMSMYLVPKTVIKRMDKHMRFFLARWECERKISFGEVAKSV
jgi:hypothetical protein